MNRALGIVAALLLLAAVPAAADWRLQAQAATWYVQRPTADMAELRLALLWHYERNALDGVMVTAARPQISITDVGGGNSELAISMTRTAGESWINAYAPVVCSDSSTLAARAACADAGIKDDLRRIWLNYRKAQQTPVAEPVLP